ncbi:anthrone oxygenase family protein [Gymnodinialimonas ulvae]|uniref:anthrone oxygenase family protein n=1 Tax=Gymnodinialimonas ulvae TaxID=3126504 RepID=UPI0030B21F5C
MREAAFASGFAALLLAGAIFGFFYAWVCSTMWGLDAIDPRVAIEAMQGMNASVRNAVFAPAFFGTPFVCLITAAFCLSGGAREAAIAFAAAGILYLLGGMGLTMAVNVPMNESLAMVEVPEDVDAAREIWAAYSPRWQVFNIARTVVSGLTLALAGLGLVALARAG